MFDIVFTAEIPVRVEDADETGADTSYDALAGRTTLGHYRESFLAPLGHRWGRADYERHWYEAARRLLDGENRTGFFTQAFWMWWIMWRDGEDVFVREQFLAPALLELLDSTPDRTQAPYSLVGPRHARDVEGKACSEWRLHLDDIHSFVSRRAAYGIA